MDLPDAILHFRNRAVDWVARVLGVLALPSAAVNAFQSVERHDVYLGVAAVVYLLTGSALLWNQRRPAGTGKVRTFVVLSTTLILGVTLTETAAGSSHLLGIGCMLIVLLGHMQTSGRHAWHVFGAFCFPGVLLLRELYRPHPLLQDPLELFPQAVAGGLAVYGIGWLFEGIVTAFAEQTHRAREAELAKDRFLENMSHELRTPLTAVVGYTELLEEEGFEDPRTAQTDLANIRQSAHHLLGIIDDLLDLSRLGQGTGRIRLVAVPLREVVMDAVNDVLPQVERAGTTLTVQPTDEVVLADAIALRRVLVNLLGNAAKFTAKGTIHVDVGRNRGLVQVDVRDSGIGFPSQLAEHIFEAFAQVDDSTTRVHGGTGLGLAISRGLIQSMQGTLTATSEPGHGATFTLTLPRAPRASLDR